MRSLLPVLLVVLVLALVGCQDEGVQPLAALPPSSAPARSDATGVTTARPAPRTGLAYRVVASLRVPLDVQGLALWGGHAAYVRAEDRLVWVSWRTGERRTVHVSWGGRLTMLTNAGRYRYLVDSVAPGRDLSLDLRTGRVRAFTPHDDALVVGQLNDQQVEVVHRRVDGQVVPAADLYLADQQPDPDVPLRRLTHGGRVVAAAYDGDHRLVWTERLPRIEDPHSLWTADLFQPQEPATEVAVPEGRPFSPVAGDGYVGWAADGQRLWLAPVSGGSATAVPGRLADDTWPAGAGRLTAVVVRDHDRNVLEVLRVDAG